MIRNNFIRKIFFQFFYLFRTPPWDTGKSPPELMSFLENSLPGRALDLGCGTATNVITLAKYGWDVVGVDFVAKAIKMGKTKMKHAGVNALLKVGDVTRLDDITGPFDLILDIGCYHVLESSEKGIYNKNIMRLLGPNGTFLLYGFLDQNNNESGLSEDDINRLRSFLNLDYRTDGEDRSRPSTWFKFSRS